MPLSKPALAASAVAVGCAIGYMLSSSKVSQLEEELKTEKDLRWNKEPKICDTILDHIGNTPLVRLNRVGKDLGAEILCKCEFFNAGGSVKDRIGRQMLVDAENSGRIQKGDTLIEPTSGNTGIGLSLAAAVMGYKMVITLPKKMSQEKVDVLTALGAIVKRTPTNAPCPEEKAGHVFSHIYKAKKVMEELNSKVKKGDRKVAHILDQYSNPSNPLAHINGTAAELYRQTDGKFDVLIATAGTGGTLAGIAWALKNKYGMKNLKVVGVDPHGSDLAVQGKGKIFNASTEYKISPPDSNGSSPKLSEYKVEGIGYDFIPKVLEGLPDVNANSRKGLVDYWYKTSDKDSFIMARRLIREEGLLCGGSCGSSVVAALQVCKDLKLGKGKRVVCILADSTRNYMTKFLSDSWMTKYNFASDTYKPVKELAELKSNSPSLNTLTCESTWQEQAQVETAEQRDVEKQYFEEQAQKKQKAAA